MVRPTYKDHWDIPGGYVEPGESPRDACAREIAEELGLHREVGTLLAVDWAPHPDDGDKLLFLFDGGVLTTEEENAVLLQEAELAEYRYVATNDLDSFTVPRLSRRVRQALEARMLGQIRYLEQGKAPQ